MTETNGSKRCGRCKELKSLEAFGKVKDRPRSYCRVCHSAANENPDLRTEKRCACCKQMKPVSEFNRLRKRFQPYCRPCGHAIVEARRVERRKTGEATEDYRLYYWKKKKWIKLKSKYGCERATYEALYEQQGGVCAICLQPETQTYKGTLIKLALDHDHGTGEIRGLLCKSCNLAIGKFKENVEIVRRAVDYLLKSLK